MSPCLPGRQLVHSLGHYGWCFPMPATVEIGSALLWQIAFPFWQKFLHLAFWWDRSAVSDGLLTDPFTVKFNKDCINITSTVVYSYYRATDSICKAVININVNSDHDSVADCHRHYLPQAFGLVEMTVWMSFFLSIALMSKLGWETYSGVLCCADQLLCLEHMKGKLLGKQCLLWWRLGSWTRWCPDPHEKLCKMLIVLVLHASRELH